MFYILAAQPPFYKSFSALFPDFGDLALPVFSQIPDLVEILPLILIRLTLIRLLS